MPVRSNWPSLWLSLVIARSPSYTCLHGRGGRGGGVRGVGEWGGGEWGGRVGAVRVYAGRQAGRRAGGQEGRGGWGGSLAPPQRHHPSCAPPHTREQTHTHTARLAWMETVVCWSWYVVKTWDFLVGTTVLRGMSLVITPPTVSMPTDRAQTSSSRMSLTSSPPSPERMPPCVRVRGWGEGACGGGEVCVGGRGVCVWGGGGVGVRVCGGGACGGVACGRGGQAALHTPPAPPTHTLAHPTPPQPSHTPAPLRQRPPPRQG